MASPQGQSYTINGIKVQFPCKAYPSQLCMMDRIIKGLERSQNSLLESPTGSGKSLALLCSSLAWQSYERVRANEANEEDIKKGVDSCCTCGAKSGSPAMPDDVTHSSGADPAVISHTPHRPALIPDIEDADFRVESKKIRGLKSPQIPVTPVTPQAAGWSMEVQPPPGCQQSPCGCQCDKQTSSPKRRVPKIYFGTRTHKQIAQIARELGKTAYKHTRMTILGSREHTCIHPEVSNMPNKNEECKNKLDGPGCGFKDRVRRITHRSIEDRGLDSGWDLEQFVAVCQKFQACPYFGSRQLREGADIIFCPYNYLIDPLVRESMEINLKGQIVILDEAHNMEDSCRDAASFSITQNKVKDALKDINIMIEENIKLSEHRDLYNMLSSFNQFIERNEGALEGEYEHASRVWMGMDIVATLKHTGVGPDDLDKLKKSFQSVTADEEEPNADLKLKSATIQCFNGLFMVLGYIYRDNMKYLDDYRVAIVRSMVYTYTTETPQEGAWINRRRRPQRQLTMCHTLHFWCLNPAVAFSDVAGDVRSVVLTSGTLSPMNTFQSELSVPFPIQLEANHVVGSGQVWVGTVSKGPRGGSLLGSYQNSETFAYQDEIGDILLKVCQTIPHGVLCFLPSYKSMEKLTNRWKSTGLFERLSEHKEVMLEPRASDKIDFDALIKDYYTVIKQHEDKDIENGGVTGALFMAVCRGKVSEGLDFADNNARAVMAVGIPFPNVKDTKIELKKNYNDRLSATRGLMRGRDWYEIQAYRAINQAFGRCIRHRNDWGALILVDERYSKHQKYVNSLSKWVRQKVQYYSTFQQAENSLKAFTKERLENPIVNSSVLCPESPGTAPSTPCVGHRPDTTIIPDPSLLQTPKTPAKSPSLAGNDQQPVATNQLPANSLRTLLTSNQPIVQANLQQAGSANQQLTVIANQQSVASQVKLRVNNQPVPSGNQQIIKMPNGQFLILSNPVANPQAVAPAVTQLRPAETKMQKSNIRMIGPDGKEVKKTLQHPVGTTLIRMPDNKIVAVPHSTIQKHKEARKNFLDKLTGGVSEAAAILDPSKLPQRYINPSQAGGFLPSQGEAATSGAKQCPNQTVTQTNVLLTQTQAGHQTHANTAALEDGEMIIDFNPAMASTQMPGTLSSIQTPLRGAAVGSADMPQRTPQGRQDMVFKTPVGKLQFDTPQPKHNAAPHTARTTGDGKSLFKFVDLTSETPSKLADKSRSDSPSLFDSDGEMDQDYVTDVLRELGSASVHSQLDSKNRPMIQPPGDVIVAPADVISAGGDVNGSKIPSPDENHPPLGRKPLFRKDVAVKSESLPVDADSGRSSRRLSMSRLSRNSVSGSDIKPELMEHVNQHVKSDHGKMAMDHNPVKQEPNDVPIKKEDPGVQLDPLALEEEELNTKRMSRNKRRRSGQASGQSNLWMANKKTRKGVDFEEEDQPDEMTKQSEVLLFSCPKCRAKLGKFFTYSRESYRPEFIKAMRRPKEPSPVGDMVTVAVHQLPDKGLKIITAEGLQLNSHWSEEDSCVVQLLGCERCTDNMRRPSASSGPPCLGAHVLITSKHNPRLKEGQVWLLPQCFKV